MKEKQCKACKKDKPIDVFIKMRHYRHAKCNPCRIEYSRKHNAKISRLKSQRLW
jgi:hypothetical protein